jgi:hypothetical protein
MNKFGTPKQVHLLKELWAEMHCFYAPDRQVKIVRKA